MIDVVIALDGSSDLTTSEFEKLKELVKNIIDNYVISKHGAQMGVIEYSDVVNIKIPLGTTDDVTQLKRLVDNITPSQGTQRFTAEALKKAAKQVFPSSLNGRPGASRVLIVITTGPMSDTEDIDKAVDETNKAGVNVFVVTVKDGEDDAGKIVPDTNVVSVKTTDDLPSAADKLDKVIKDSIDKSKSINCQTISSIIFRLSLCVVFLRDTLPGLMIFNNQPCQ